ncbi:MAG TPA: hypothetical protein VGF88_23630 [Acidobacteriaceae bacterium]|jgi:hypothetical protein
MPWEWSLIADGYREQREERTRQEAGYLAMILTAQCGKPITAAQLLGEETAEQTEGQKLSAGERRISEMKRKLKRLKKKKGKSNA